MRLVLLVVAVAGLLLLAPAASAERYTGSLAAESIHVQGTTGVASASLMTRVGGGGHAFDAPPVIALTANRIVYEHEYHEQAIVEGVGEFETSSGGFEIDTVRGAVASFDAWLPEGSEVVVQTMPGGLLASGTTTGQAFSPTPLRVLEDDREWTIGQREGTSVNLDGSYRFRAEAGSLVFAGSEFSRKIQYDGNFILYVFGADLRLNHEGGVAQFQSGYRSTQSGPAGESWLNVTKLRVYTGHLTIEPGANTVASYAPDATVAGTGTVLMQGATGVLKGADAEGHAVSAQDLNLVGDYQLSMRGSTQGLLAGIVGEFESSLFGFQAAKVASASSSWWWLAIAVGLVAVGGVGGVLLVRRRSAAPTPTLLEEPAPPAPPGPPMEVREAPHLEPDFAWDELNEEFGVVRAGEKSGVLIVLVPENRIQPFLHAVVARGLMAEDTGDRIHAGDNVLAVVALEPSPLMMN